MLTHLEIARKDDGHDDTVDRNGLTEDDADEVLRLDAGSVDTGAEDG